MTTARVRAHSTGRPPSKDGAERRSPGRSRFMGVLLILMSLISAAACYLVFSWWLPSDSERYQDYRAAEACSSRAMQHGQTDCLSTWHLTVEKTVNKTSGKSSTFEATLKYQDSWRGTVSFGNPGPLLERLAPGDQVTATAWRRDIVVLSKNGVRQNTSGLYRCAARRRGPCPHPPASRNSRGPAPRCHRHDDECAAARGTAIHRLLQRP
ncbi:hypothetical protein ABZ656_19300 [Streptomyces sp. NPDC007095]|uniref:hypothetical protein n=1 Tax=Streptomyces sp. NPDC007095 TaxID=3154482 RepID=UPI0033FED8A2